MREKNVPLDTLEVKGRVDQCGAMRGNGIFDVPRVCSIVRD